MPARFKFENRLIDDDLLERLVAKGWLYGPTARTAMERKPETAEDVEFIDLAGSKVTDKGMRAVLDCINVTGMSIGQTEITDATLKRLTRFKKLTHLFLRETKVTAAGLQAVAELPIKYVFLGYSELSEDMFRVLGKMTALENLQLTRTKMKAPWLKHITALPRLKELSLNGADFDDAAVKHVSGLGELGRFGCTPHPLERRRIPGAAEAAETAKARRGSHTRQSGRHSKGQEAIPEADDL